MRIAGDFGNMHSFDSPFCIPWFTKSATIHIAYVGFLWIMRVLLWRELKMMPLIYFLTLCNMHALLFQRHTDDEKMMYQAFFVGNSHIIKFEAFWSPFSEITASQLSVTVPWRLISWSRRVQKKGPYILKALDMGISKMIWN